MKVLEPRLQAVPEMASLTEQAARCRRLAAVVGDGITRARLLEIAVEYEAEMAEMFASL
jgi:hypothetical protein